MDLTLTTTWHPRGEMERIVRLLPESRSLVPDIDHYSPTGGCGRQVRIEFD